MLSEEAKNWIREAWENKEKNKKFSAPALTREEIRLRDLKNSEALSYVYQNTDVTRELFDGVPTDVMLPKTLERRDVFFFIHGGAWAFGSAMNARLTACCFTEDLHGVALCPEYRLAPEHKYSELLDDCYRAFKEAVKRYGAENIILSGSSAGGNLSLALMQKLREEKGAYPKGLLLFSPVVLIDKEKEGFRMAHADLVLGEGYNEGYVATFGDTEEYYKNHYMSPLYGEYEGFPPMYIAYGSEEILLSEGVELFKKIKKQGVDAVLNVRAGMWHSYPECQFFIPEGKETILEGVAYLDEAAKKRGKEV